MGSTIIGCTLIGKAYALLLLLLIVTDYGYGNFYALFKLFVTCTVGYGFVLVLTG